MRTLFLISRNSFSFINNKYLSISHFSTSKKTYYNEGILQNHGNLKNYFNKDSYEQEIIDRLYTGIKLSDRACLAESITLVESRNKTKKLMGQVLLQLISNQGGMNHRESNFMTKCFPNNSELKDKAVFTPTLRIGITGPPGAGKSTFIESFGMNLVQDFGLKVAVLAIDPSSVRTGGSLLGDKTRMSKLSVEPMAYVRPSPSSGELGGVARNTMETVLLCEGAGYDVIIVETVGVGQSEVAVANMTDMFVLIIPPAGGDELQGLKRGVIENCDFVLVNKSDGDLLPAARRIQSEYTSAMKFIPRKYQHWRPRVRRISSKNGEGIDHFWGLCLNFYEAMIGSGCLEENRKDQRNVWMWNHLKSDILQHFRENADVVKKLPAVKGLVENGTITPGLASDILLKDFFSEKNDL